METILHVGLSNAAVATVLALLAATFSLRCRRPALVHGLWLLVLLKLVTPPLVRIPIVLPPAAAQRTVEPARGPDPSDEMLLLPNNQVAVGSVNLVNEGAFIILPAETVSQWTGKENAAVISERPDPAPEATSNSAVVPVTWERLLLVIWVTGSAAWFLLAAWRVVRFQRLIQHARAAPATWQRRADELARDMGLAASPPVQLVPGRLPPMLWAVGRARLLLPAALLEQVGPESLDALLAHELAHVCRRDHWVRVLEFVSLGLYWWLPSVWLARRGLREAEEQCCDAWVVATLPGSTRAYADAILDTLDFLSSAPAAAPLLASGLGQVTDLKRRLRMIMTGTTPRALSWRGGAAVLALGLLLLPLLPTWVQGEPGAAADEKERPRVRPEGREAPRGKDAEKAKAELAPLQEEVNKKAAELAEASRKLHEAARIMGVRPNDAGLPPPRGRGAPQAFILRMVDNNWVLMPLPPEAGRFLQREGGPGERGPGEGRFDRRPPPPRDGERPDGPPPGPGGRERRGPAGPGGAVPGGGDRVEQLEHRLEAVMRQLEEIRRELGPRRPGEPPPPPRRGDEPRRPGGEGRPGPRGAPERE